MPPAGERREAGLQQAVTLAAPPAEPDTRPLGKLRARTHDTPPRPHYTPPPAPGDTGPMPKLSKYAARRRPQRPADWAIFVWSKVLEQHIMKCGQAHFVAGDNPDGSDDTWRMCQRRYADPITATMPFAFEALRVSAWTSMWRLDAFDRWACPACQLTPAWHARYTVTLYDDQAAQARLARDGDAERWYRGTAEHAVRERTLRHYDNSHAHGAHAAVTR